MVVAWITKQNWANTRKNSNLPEWPSRQGHTLYLGSGTYTAAGARAFEVLVWGRSESQSIEPRPHLATCSACQCSHYSRSIVELLQLLLCVRAACEWSNTELSVHPNRPFRWCAGSAIRSCEDGRAVPARQVVRGPKSHKKKSPSFVRCQRQPSSCCGLPGGVRERGGIRDEVCTVRWGCSRCRQLDDHSPSSRDSFQLCGHRVLAASLSLFLLFL